MPIHPTDRTLASTIPFARGADRPSGRLGRSSPWSWAGSPRTCPALRVRDLEAGDIHSHACRPPTGAGGDRGRACGVENPVAGHGRPQRRRPPPDGQEPGQARRPRCLARSSRSPVPAPEPCPCPTPRWSSWSGPSGSGKSTWAAARYRAAGDRLVRRAPRRGRQRSARPRRLRRRLRPARDDRRRPARPRPDHRRRHARHRRGRAGSAGWRRRASRRAAGRRGRPGHPGRRRAGAATPRATCRCPRRSSPRSCERHREHVDRLADEGWDLVHTVDRDASRRCRAAPGPRPRPAGDGPPDLAGPQGRAPGLPLPVGRGPAGLARATIATGGGRGRLLGPGADGPPDPDPAGRPGVGADPRAVGDARRRRRRWAPGCELGTLVTPVTFRAPGITAKAAATLDVLTGGRAFVGVGAGWWEREHAAYGLAVPARPRAARRARARHRDDARAVGAGHQGVRRRAGRAARDDLLPAAGGPHPGHRRRQRASATLRIAAPARRRGQRALGASRGSTSCVATPARPLRDGAGHRARPADRRPRPRRRLGAGRAAARPHARGGVRRAHPCRDGRRAAGPLRRAGRRGVSTRCSWRCPTWTAADDVRRGWRRLLA